MTKVAVKVAAKKASCSEMDVRTADSLSWYEKWTWKHPDFYIFS